MEVKIEVEIEVNEVLEQLTLADVITEKQITVTELIDEIGDNDFLDEIDLEDIIEYHGKKEILANFTAEECIEYVDGLQLKEQ